MSNSTLCYHAPMRGTLTRDQPADAMHSQGSQGQSSAASATDVICRIGTTHTRVRWCTRPSWPYRQSDQAVVAHELFC